MTALDMSKMDVMLKASFKLKSKMLEKGITYAYTNCPLCGGKLYAKIVGRKKHIHAKCETDGCIALME